MEGEKYLVGDSLTPGCDVAAIKPIIEPQIIEKLLNSF